MVSLRLPIPVTILIYLVLLGGILYVSWSIIYLMLTCWVGVLGKWIINTFRDFFDTIKMLVGAGKSNDSQNESHLDTAPAPVQNLAEEANEMPNMTSADSLCLFKDYCLETTLNQCNFVKLRAAQICLSENLDGSSMFNKIILDVLEDAKNKQSALFAFYTGNRTTRQPYIYNIVIYKPLLEGLAGMLPKPVILVRGKMQTRGGVIIIDECLSISNLLNHVVKHGIDQINHQFASLPIDNVVPGNFTFDILIGWGKATLNKIKLCPGSFMQTLFANDLTKNLTIVCGNGAEIKCHKLILEAHSTVFAAMTSPTNAMVEFQTGRIELKEYSEEAIHRLVQYLYCADDWIIDQDECDIAIEIFQLADKYDIPHLQNSLHGMFLQKDVAWFSADAIVELYFYARDSNHFGKLREHILHIMSCMDPQKLLESRELNRMGLKDAIHLLGEVMKVLQRKGNSSLDWSIS